MKTSSLAVSLLLLSLLLSQAQGIRLDKGFGSAGKQNNDIQLEESGVTKTSSNVASPEDSSTLISSCKDGGECSSSGSTRKLISMTSSTTSSTTVSKNEKNNGRNHRADPEPKGEKVKTQVVLGGEDGNAKAMLSSSVVSKHLEAVHQHYRDLVDLTEMDYSPARRKPPIHN